MLQLPSKFKQALGNGTRTSLYPLVRIYKGYQIDDTIPNNAEAINLSVKETTIKNLNNTYEGYMPLLLKSPSISSSADIINNKYTISSVSLSISNAPYNGKIFSDDIPSLLNAVVQVYYASNGLDSLDDCLLVYTGTIRRYSQSAETLNLTLEDLTQQKLETKIPATLIEDDGYHKTEDIGKPYPMVYGLVDKSPLIYNLENKLEIDKPNRNIKNYWTGEGIMNFGNSYITEEHRLATSNYLGQNAFLSIYEGGFVPIYRTGARSWGSRVHENLQGTVLYDFINSTDNYSAHIILNNDTFVYEGKQYDEDAQEYINIGKQGIPARLYRPITKVSFAGINDFSLDPESENRFIGYQDDTGIMTAVAEEINHSGNNRDDEFGAQGLYDEFWNDGPQVGEVLKYWQPTKLNEAYINGEENEIFDYVDRNWEEFYDSYSAAYFPVDWIQNGQLNTGLHISAQNMGTGSTNDPRFGCFARLQIEDNIGSLPCVTKIFYDIDYFSIGNLWTGGGARQNAPVKFWVERELVYQKGLAQRYGTAQGFLDSIYLLWEEFRDDDDESTDWTTYCIVPNTLHDFEINLNAEEAGYDDLGYTSWAHIISTHGIASSDGYNNIIKNFDTTNATDTINWGMAQMGDSTAIQSCIANLKEIYIIQDALITDYNKRKYHADIAGRTQDDELILSANQIMSDILKDELLYDGTIDESAADVQIDPSTGNNAWQYSFTLNQQKEAKSLFEGMFKSSLLIPSFDSAGQFKFIGIKQIISSNKDVVFINTQDVIKYSFELTKIDDIYNSVNVRYKINYATGEYDKQTGYTIADTPYTTLDDYTSIELGYGQNSYNVEYYGLSSEDTKLEVETEYIRDKYTAQRLQKRLLLWYANQHLIVKIDLPPSYMNLEAGDYIRLNELLGNKLAFGYDYTKNEHRNGQLIYPVFFVTRVSKSLDKVSIQAVQVHRGEFGFQGLEEDADPNSIDEGIIVNGDGDDVTENNQIPDPQDDPNYSEDSIGTDDFEIEVDDYFRIQMSENRTLNTNQVVGFVSTNMNESWEYNIWVRTITSAFEYNGVQYNVGEYEVGDLSGMDLVNHALTMQDNNGYITIERKFEIFPQGAVIEFVLEVKNTQFVLEEGFDQLGINEEDITLGDLNNDLVVNVLDVVRLVQIILGHGNEPTNLEEIAGNANQDDRLNVQDVIILINQILGQ